MYVVLEMPQSRLVPVNDEMFVSRFAGSSDDDPGADDFLSAPSYGNCAVELTFDDLWDDETPGLSLRTRLV